MNRRSNTAFEDAREKLDDAKRYLDKGNGINRVADCISGAMTYAIDGWLAAHGITRNRDGSPLANHGDSFYAFRQEAAFEGCGTIGNIQSKAARLDFWLLGDPDIPADKPFSMEEWQSAAYALIEEARAAIDLTERDCR